VALKNIFHGADKTVDTRQILPRFGHTRRGIVIASLTGETNLNIRFTSSLTPEDENVLAPVVLTALAGILDLLPIAYIMRIDTSDSQVYQHTGDGSKSHRSAEPDRPVRSAGRLQVD
jgi:hypothetical protein